MHAAVVRAFDAPPRQGSIPLAQIVAELPRIAGAIATGKIAVNPLHVPLADVERAWTDPAPAGQRVVLIP